jgi:hypothetical protein
MYQYHETGTRGGLDLVAHLHILSHITYSCISGITWGRNPQPVHGTMTDFIGNYYYTQRGRINYGTTHLGSTRGHTVRGGGWLLIPKVRLDRVYQPLPHPGRCVIQPITY